eukprot:COSAG05_NODE_1729_length_4192_cov_1.698510_1_plen_54_part_00
MIGPPYGAFYAQWSGFGFTNPDKYVKFTPQEVDGALRSYFLTPSETSEARMSV